ncbi:DUF3291 domain-containing protein [Aquimarina sp. U1-2]|uniref:DUF3291 domain-containing protein n=1 Tax=Aquimarina sp. U1-2 TaxID=2823141 RepID=UPI001FEF4886|nr:DUF3291 domain-containing protein [Aquimarina sp. U1-2]
MMLFMPSKLNKLNGQTFFKLMGSGHNGFDPLPDWNVYALLQVWENEAAADHFFATSTIMSQFRNKASEVWTVYMKNINSKGFWTGSQPFVKGNITHDDSHIVAVITRATIKINKLLPFWRYVPRSRAPLGNQKGLLFTKGIGAKPFVQMATFSVWKDKQALFDYAYKSAEHQEAIKKTKTVKWYSEELFARFQPYKTIGSWEGRTTIF